ncbi:hypothetical protein AX14_003036 [Amanita brunnescens Koide BX004]|nr:hypothetical protein AX14_003036 [Amanita brunnescens Koide BX004]
MGPVGDRLHAIWLCITAPHAGGSMFQPWDEKIFHLNQRKGNYPRRCPASGLTMTIVPIIVVYTKFDLIIPTRSKGKARSRKEGDCQGSAESYFKERYGKLFEASTKNIEGQIPYTAVATSLPETLQRLVDVTLTNVHVETPTPTSALPRGRIRSSIKSTPNNQSAGQDEDLSDAAEIVLATAQGVDMPAKITASIKVGRKKYWRAIASGIHFLNVSLEKCLFAIHKDIVTIWNIRDLDKILPSDEFRRRMKVIVEDLSRPDQMNTSALQGRIPISAAAGLASAWTKGVYKRLPEHIRCLMGYVVDLTLILEAAFQVSHEELGQEAFRERLDEIIREFHLSERKKTIHTAIWAFVGAQRPFSKAMVDKIELLIKDNEITMRDMQFDQKRPALPSLITIIRYELSVKGQIVNKTTLHLMRKLLGSRDYGAIDSELGSASDVELLLSFILHLLRSGSLMNSGIRGANQKARRLMYDLISKRNVMPGSLFLTDVKANTDIIAIGGFGRVFKGEHKGQPVALKVLTRGHKNGSLRKDSGREALAWRSLTKHRFILPLMGVFEDKLQLFLVLPFMANGTLSEWRKRNQAPPLGDIHNLILEVAEGLQHIHSEGIVHGDLRGENILLDANFHCQIADIGLTQNSDAIITLSASAFLFNYAAPELFVTQSEGDVVYEDHDLQKGSKTVKTDIYAFGCLYYAIFFNTVPFQGKYEYQIMRLVTSGGRPRRLESPRMDNSTWTIIQSCWRNNPVLRPAIEDIRTQMQLTAA